MSAKSSQDQPKKRPKWRGTRTVTEILTEVLEPVLARKTGMTIDLIRGWPELVGREYSTQTRPEKINWPRKRQEDDPFEPGVLIVACEPSAALFFQHEQAQIIERVNLFFGFEAVKRIKIVQKPVVKRAKFKEQSDTISVDLPNQEKLDLLLEQIEDDELRAKLKVLGVGVFGKNNES